MEKQAEKQGKPSPINGVIAPIERRFQKGKSGNPNGFSKKARALIDFNEYFDKHPDDWGAIIAKGAERAKRGDFQFWNAITERLKGKVPNKNEVTGKDGSPFDITISVVSEKAAKDSKKLREMFSGEN